MTFEQLVEVVALDRSVTKKGARENIEQLFSVIKEQVRDGGEVRIPGFGRFYRIESKARVAKLPSPNGPVEKTVPAKWRTRFSPAKDLKGEV